jgi:hypothetical protein
VLVQRLSVDPVRTLGISFGDAFTRLFDDSFTCSCVNAREQRIGIESF